MVSGVAKVRPDAVITYCTNFPAAHLVDGLERQFDVPVYDSVSAGVWGALRLAGVTTGSGDQWGRLFGTAG
jgi:maleate isomerase